MQPTDQKPVSLLDLLSRYWFLIFFLGGMAVTWGSFSSRINLIESKVASLEIKQEKNGDSLSLLQGDIREIKTSLEFIKERLK